MSFTEKWVICNVKKCIYKNINLTSGNLAFVWKCEGPGGFEFSCSSWARVFNQLLTIAFSFLLSDFLIKNVNKNNILIHFTLLTTWISKSKYSVKKLSSFNLDVKFTSRFGLFSQSWNPSFRIHLSRSGYIRRHP